MMPSTVTIRDGQHHAPPRSTIASMATPPATPPTRIHTTNGVHPHPQQRHADCTRRAALIATVTAALVPVLPVHAEEFSLLPSTSAAQLNANESKVLEINQRVQAQNNAPLDFPTFVRTGYNVKVLGDGYTIRDDGLIYRDFVVGSGEYPAEGQEVTFDYTAYNESGSRIDSTYLRGRPAQTRIGIGGLIPGFEEGIKGMRVGGKRRIVVPPELGPPVGPATFFSAKQFEVFDVELRALRNCQRTQTLIFSSVVCE